MGQGGRIARSFWDGQTISIMAVVTIGANTVEALLPTPVPCAIFITCSAIRAAGSKYYEVTAYLKTTGPTHEYAFPKSGWWTRRTSSLA